MKNLRVGGLVAGLMALCGVAVWLGGWLWLAPINPPLPYFDKWVDGQGVEVSGVDWPLEIFRPVIWQIFEKDNGIYARAAYRDLQGQPQLITLFLGGLWQGKQIPLAPIDRGESFFYPEDMTDYSGLVGRGNQVGVWYLVDAKLTGTAEEVELCAREGNICPLAEAFYQEDEFQHFALDSNYSGGQVLPVLYLEL